MKKKAEFLLELKISGFGKKKKKKKKKQLIKI